MIKKLNNVKNFGIFENIPASPSYANFNKFNLFYGFNGSGKSTLSHQFSLLESKDIQSRFPDSKWNFTLDDGSVLSELDVINPSLNIKVFDKGFIERNIDWNKSIKGILVVSEDKKEEIQQLNDKKKEQKDIIGKIDKSKLILDGDGKRNGAKGIIKDISNFLTEAAKNLKARFLLIEVEDTYLSNYNKTKIEKALTDYKTEIKKTALTILEIENLAKTIKPQEKEILTEPDLSIINLLDGASIKICEILKSTVTSVVIENLKDDQNKAEWVKTGISLHSIDEKCLFCGNQVTKERIEELNNHFNESFNILRERIEVSINWVSNISLPDINTKSDFFSEYQEEYSEKIKNLDTEKNKCKEIFEEWLVALNLKKTNPFEVIDKEFSKYDFSILSAEYNDLITIIKKHNKKINDSDSIIKKAKAALEIEYIKEEIKRYNYYTQKTKEDSENSIIAKLQTDLVKTKAEIEILNAKVSTESLGATNFNKDLHKFLGRKDIALQPQEEGGYKIQRNGDLNTKAKFLSEGEKTAIAFVYFINKLKEQDNKISDSIIVVDDPISSFDSNNLFSSYSFLKNNCDDAKQLFVLTHNFNYYRLVRDWFDTKNNKARNKHKEDESKPKSLCNIYSIESQINPIGARVSKIKDADNTLLKYTSEYHYLFNKLIEYATSDIMDIDKAYLTANASRRILETFLKFKYPKKRNDFRKLFEIGISSTSLKEKEEEIYKFINKYSHAQDFDNDSTDNQLDEGTNITTDILNIIKELDKTHYDEMLEACKN